MKNAKTIYRDTDLCLEKMAVLSTYFLDFELILLISK